MRALIVLALCALAVRAAVPADEVTSLPGWNGPLPSKHYSGYLPVGNGSSAGYLHYWFIESESNPATDPVVLWLNGGPGSSSLIGLLTENGQFQLNDNSFTNTSSVPQLIYNPYSWNRVANVIFLESPKGVGFSYCINKAECKNTDESTAADAYQFLVNWFKAFPEYANNDFAITGESYAGIYIPMLMDQISKNGGINLKMAAIGNGCWGNAVGTCSFNSGDSQRISFNFYAGHAMIPQDLIAQINTECGDFTKLSVKCLALLAEQEGKIGSFDIYNIYDACGDDQVSMRDIRQRLSQNPIRVNDMSDSLRIHAALGGALNDYACGASRAMDAWLSLPEVAKALHVKTGVSGMDYTRTVADLRPLYKTLIQKYRTVIYSGDVDGCVPYYGSEEWTRALGFTVKEAWRPWRSGTEEKPESVQRAGYVITYDVPNQDFDFTFITVTGAGHMVPQFRPVRALALFERFLKNSPF